MHNLVSHDGLRDSLTGLLSLPAFMESASREISAAQRNGQNINLFLFSLTEKDEIGKSVFPIRLGREITELSEQALADLASRILSVSQVLARQLRKNDLIARYTFAQFLIMNSGEFQDISEKLSSIASAVGAVVAGKEWTKINSSDPFSLTEAMSAVEAETERLLSVT